MIYLNLGRREQGKTTLAYYLVSKQPTRVIFDPRAMFHAERRLTTLEEITAGFDRLHETAGGAELVITPENDVQGCFEHTAAEVKAFLQTHRPIAFLVDEISMVQTVTPTFHAFNWILRLCPRQQAIIVLTGHRPVDVSTDVRAISDMWLLFAMTQEHDLEIIKRRCSPDVAARLPKLPPYHFIAWDEGKGSATVNRNPGGWYVKLRNPAVVQETQPAAQLEAEPLARPGPAGGLFDV